MTEDQLAQSIRHYYEAITRRLTAVPSTSITRRPRSRALVVAAAALIAFVTIGLIVLLSPTNEPAIDTPTSTVTTITLPSSSTTAASDSSTTTVAPDTEVGWQVNPLMSPYYALPTCDRHDLILDWMAVHAPAGRLDGGDVVAVTLEEVVRMIPLYRASGARCADAVIHPDDGADGLMGWLLLDAEGRVVARAVGWLFEQQVTDVPLAEEPSLVALGGEYHQDWMPSGHPLTGWVADGLVAADTKPNVARQEFARFFIDVPGYVLPGEGVPHSDGQRAGDLITDLGLADLSPVGGFDLTFSPTEMPEGFARCWGPYWRGQIDGIEEPGNVTIFCDSDGETIAFGAFTFGLSLADPVTGQIEVSGLALDVFDRAERRLLVGAGDNAWGVAVALDAPAWVTLEDLAIVLQSVPALDPRNRTPADGTNDLRSLLSDEWLVSVITASGAVDVESSDRYHSTLAYTWRPDPAQSGSVLGSFEVYDTIRGPAFDTTEIFTHAGVDVFVNRSPGNPASQALAPCGGVWINIIFNGGDGDPVVTAIMGFIDSAGC